MLGRARGEHSRCSSSSNRAPAAAAKARKLLPVSARGALRPAPHPRKTSMDQEAFYNTFTFTFKSAMYARF